MPKLTVRRGSAIWNLHFDGNPRLTEVLLSNHLPIARPCGGRGICGKCAVELGGQVSAPNAAEEKAGCRLACQAVLLGDAEAILPADSAMEQIALSSGVEVCAIKPMQGRFGAAVDIGTTTLACRLYDLRSGACIAEAGQGNPQTAVAADVMGRIGHALHGGLETLRVQVEGGITSVLEDVCAQANMASEALDALVLTGNTTMLFLLTNQDVDCLSHAPFEATDLFGREAPELSFPAAPGASCYLTRCNSAFVGGDITTAVLASGIAEDNRTSLLIDVGTNGEIVLAHQGKLSCSSTAAGPALEGAGIYMGMPAMGGAISRVFLQDGKIETETVGNLPDTGICGSGVIDAMAVLLKTGAVEETGLLLEEDHDFTDRICEAGTTLAFRIGEKTLFTQKDIRAVQLAKAAICAGIRTLLHEAGLKPSDVERFVIAGGFGSHIQVDNAAAIGLFPPELAGKAEVLGNAALEGAAMLLQNRSFYESSYELAAQMETVDLSSNPYFSDQYMDSMIFEV